MKFNKCVRCGCFFASTDDVCPSCKSKDEVDKLTLKNYLDNADTPLSLDSLSFNSGVELKNINIHITGSTNVSFIGDYNWEFEALSNILKNSIEYTPDNKNIYISFKENNVYTEIIIRDEGKGMTKKEQKRIFERFFKGSNSENNNFGIGLSLAKEIINKDNGTIKVVSTLNVGTTFKIRYYK